MIHYNVKWVISISKIYNHEAWKCKSPHRKEPQKLTSGVSRKHTKKIQRESERNWGVGEVRTQKGQWGTHSLLSLSSQWFQYKNQIAPPMTRWSRSIPHAYLGKGTLPHVSIHAWAVFNNYLHYSKKKKKG